MAEDDDAGSLLAAARQLPYGEAYTRTLERALRAAEQHGTTVTVFDVLKKLVSAYGRGGEPAKALGSFARLVSAYDAARDTFERPERAARRVRWYYKWAIGSMLQHPEFELDRIHAALDDMERRYLADGQSLHAVHIQRYFVARHVGDDDAADRWHAAWAASPEDRNADCPGCGTTRRVRRLVAGGRDEEAIEAAAPALAERPSCGVQPQKLLTSLLFAYVRTGRLESAADAHRRAYRAHRHEPSHLGQIGTHVRFCALTGNVNRGLEIVERHLSWPSAYASPDGSAGFASDTAVLLDRIPPSTTVRTAGARVGPAPVGAELPELPERMTAGELAGRLWRWAHEIAERFDRRNGTTSYSDRIRGERDAEPLVEDLPLAPYQRRTRPAAPPDLPSGPKDSENTMR